MKTSPRAFTLHALAWAAVAFCGAAHAELSLPASLAGKAVVLNPSDPDYARAMVTSAVQPAGMGGVSEALVVKMTTDIPVWRMWNGPAKLDANGRTNRIGGWWGYDAPKGTAADYRTNYEICKAWNDLTWMAQCTLKAGAVVAIGPGQSVTAATCGDVTNQENYAANPRDWQLYINKPWARGTELVCPADTDDYPVDPADISRRRP
jgi:hypothetical protein